MFNFTPHTICVVLQNGGKVDVPSSGEIRVSEKRQDLYVYHMEMAGIRLQKTEFGEISFPEVTPPEGATIIVSALVRAAIEAGAKIPAGWQSCYFVSPDTGKDALREDGKIVAVRGFVVG